MKSLQREELKNLANGYEDFMGSPQYSQEMERYNEGLGLINLLLSQKDFLTKNRYSETGTTYDIYPKIEEFIYKGNGIYFMGLKYTKEENLHGYRHKVEKSGEISTSFLNTPDEVTQYLKNLEIDKLKKEAENLPEKAIMDSILGLAMLGADIYIGPGLTIPASIMMNLASDNIDPIEGLTDDSLIKSKGGRLAAGSIDIAGGNLLNSYKDRQKLNNDIERALHEMYMDWFGSAGIYKYRIQNPSGAWGEYIEDYPLYMDITNPKEIHHMQKWYSDGLTSWADKETVEFLNTRGGDIDKEILAKEKELGRLKKKEGEDYEKVKSEKEELEKQKNSIDRIVEGKYTIKEKGKTVEKNIFEDLDQFRKDMKDCEEILRERDNNITLKTQWENK
ncbi:hypothetical protein [Miniphocaeibacter massiliensis]|uniref:hypothetical protein n=1 Tax=Miniphocaeibacter massiliensis TaxID=2041841 RepID=UPI000C1C02F5|nr:hypothetical protein [Miniphocaeibacter massiliensis]